MRYFVFLLLFGGLFSTVSAQDRQQTLEKFNDIKNQAKVLERKILSPDEKDIETALRENVGVFRILPRETYDTGLFSTRGGGAYYSFYFRITDYGHGSDIQLSQNNFSVGFAGADFGFIADLGNLSLSNSDELRRSANYLLAFKAPSESAKAREEHQKGWHNGFEIDGVNYRNRIPAVVGHTYAVRSINYEYSDVLAAFNVYRKDADGSLIIFWKLIEQFETPTLNGSRKTQSSDEKILSQIKSWARSDMFPDIQGEVNNGVVTLRGKIAKNKLAYAVQLANGAGATKVINLLTVE